MRVIAQRTTQERLAPFICEFVGTFLLVFVAACCACCGDKTFNATAVGFAFTALLYSVGNVSGGHLNPCVTLILVLIQRIDFFTSVLYIVVQMLAGFLAGTLASFTFHNTLSVAPVEPFKLDMALTMEFAYTTLLCFVAANVRASKRNNPIGDENQFYALAIGFVIIAGGYAAGDVSGALFNPALAVGLDLTALSKVSSDLQALVKLTPLHNNLIFYIGIEVAGSVFAAFLFCVFRHEEFLRDGLGFHKNGPHLFIRGLAEFIGTFVLVLTFGLNVIMRNTMTPWSSAGALICMTYALGNISGGHFNPAVTVAVKASGRQKCSMRDCIVYVLAQLIASIVCSYLFWHVHAAGPTSSVAFGLGPAKAHCKWIKISHAFSVFHRIHIPAIGINWCQGWIETCVSEFVYTFLIAYVVLCAATIEQIPSPLLKKQNSYFALAIGSCMTIAGVATSKFSGGPINPAVSLGLTFEASLSSNSTITGPAPLPPFFYDAACKHLLWYSLSELGGGLLAAVAFRLTHEAEFGKLT